MFYLWHAKMQHEQKKKLISQQRFNNTDHSRKWLRTRWQSSIMWHTLLIVSIVSLTPDEELTLAWGRCCLGGKPELGTLPGSYLTSHRVKEAVCNMNCLTLNTEALAFRPTVALCHDNEGPCWSGRDAKGYGRRNKNQEVPVWRFSLHMKLSMEPGSYNFEMFLTAAPSDVRLHEYDWPVAWLLLGYVSLQDSKDQGQISRFLPGWFCWRYISKILSVWPFLSLRECSDQKQPFVDAM